MAKREKAIHIDVESGTRLGIYTDLSKAQLEKIEGVSLVFDTSLPMTVYIDKRYDQDEIIAEITALAEAKATNEV